MKRVIVSGFINQTYVFGTDRDVEVFLKNIKEQQQSLIELDDMKMYNKEMPKFRDSMIHTHGNYFNNVTK